MKILIACRGIFPDFIGGSHKHNYELVKNISKYADEIHVIHPTLNKHFRHLSNIKEIYIEYGINAYTYTKNIALYLNNRSFDIAYSDGFALWKHFKKSKNICIYNGHGFHFSQKHFFWNQFKISPIEAIKLIIFDKIREIIARDNIKNSDYVISMSSTISRLLQAKFNCNDKKIINSSEAIEIDGARLNLREKGLDGKFIFLSVGNLEHRKGLTYLIKAHNDLDCDSLLCIVGDGPLKLKLMNIADKKRTVFLGKLSNEDLIMHYCNAHCFVFAGLAEAGPIVVLEAMYYALPVIATDVGAVRDMVSEKCGFIVPPGSSEALSEKMKIVYELKSDIYFHMASKSKKIVNEKFNWDNVAKKLIDDFSSIIRIESLEK